MAAALPYAVVVRVADRLEAQGLEVSARTVKARLGYGSRRTIQRHLNVRQRAQTRYGPHTEVPESCLKGGGPAAPAILTNREAEAARLDQWIAARRAQGHGHSTPPDPPPPTEEPVVLGKEGRQRVRELTLARQLLDEVVPWLPAIPKEITI